MELYFDAAYVEDGRMGVQGYLRDNQGRYANLGWNEAQSMNADNWYTLSRIIIDSTPFGWAEPDFDLSAVPHIGVELVLDGKATDVRRDIKLDNIKVVEGSV